ncbi:sensor histidine kinase [Pseudactinotalea sp. HY158]|uniref:sensor histidine kinase n=1 Tax=Pseudactinotalea sp. HY158 TaxID=2654547 RepID=UPI001E2E3969|nr:histidine kinase [Pseudactinotalea sp. HY158]
MHRRGDTRVGGPSSLTEPGDSLDVVVEPRGSWRDFWSFTPLNKYGRIALAAIVGVALLSNAVITLSSESDLAKALAEIGLLVAVGTFAWRPPAAAVAMAFAGFFLMNTPVSGPYVLALAVVAGLVVLTCRPRLSAGYLVALVGWAVVVDITGDTLAEGAAFGIVAVGLASAGVGWALRSSKHREEALAADVDRLTIEAARAIREERDRIADELHNIIAHDITIVVMHARTLELLDDSAERKHSTEVIITAASQALTDIRRMLHIAHGTTTSSPDADAGDEAIVDTLRSIRQELTDLGARVEFSVPEQLTVSNAINATLRHVARECATNIMKHAPGSPAVRVSLVEATGTVSLTIANAPDHGRGRRSGAATGYGLDRMAHRVTLLGGTFETGMKGTYWVVSATVPVS